jgi:hypothetical protein
VADTRETDRPVVTAIDGLRDFFTQYPFPGKDIVWLADELLRIAQHFGSIHIESCPDESGLHGVSYSSPEAPDLLVPHPRFRIGMLRSILARLAVLCSQETGSDFQPYGGRYTLRRSSRVGPVLLEIAFQNNPGCQQLQITRVPVDLTRHSDPTGNGTSPSVAPAAPPG